jgi:hypothetical protein
LAKEWWGTSRLKKPTEQTDEIVAVGGQTQIVWHQLPDGINVHHDIVNDGPRKHRRGVDRPNGEFTEIDAY